jgi:hypothetical protein
MHVLLLLLQLHMPNSPTLLLPAFARTAHLSHLSSILGLGCSHLLIRMVCSANAD